MSKLFVYGTLKKGFVNQPLLDGQKYLGKAVLTDPCYKLYEVEGRYKFPALVRSQIESYCVYGELYEVGNKCLSVLDRLEGVNYDLYKRSIVEVLNESGETIPNVIAYEYLQSIENLKQVGPVWPLSELAYYKSIGLSFRQEEKNEDYVGVALWNHHQEVWASDIFENEQDLITYCVLKPKYGQPSPDGKPWSNKYFDMRARKGERKITNFYVIGQNKQSPYFKTQKEMALWAKENLKFFGNFSGCEREWESIINENLLVIQ